MKTFVRFSILCTLLFASGQMVRAQEREPRRQPDPNLPTQIELLLSPAAEPRPALKYSLGINSRERKPGNAVPFYHRALLSQRSIPEAHHKRFNEKEEQWFEQPLTSRD